MAESRVGIDPEHHRPGGHHGDQLAPTEVGRPEVLLEGGDAQSDGRRRQPPRPGPAGPVDRWPGTPVHPRPMIQATVQKTRAIDQHRPAHRKRWPRASSRGTRAATTNPQASGETPMGPTAKRSNDPHDAAPEAGVGTPKTTTAPRPAARTPISHGRQMTPATRVDPSASPAPARPTATRRTRTDERRRARGRHQHDDGGGGHERDQHGLEQAQGDHVPDGRCRGTRPAGCGPRTRLRRRTGPSGWPGTGRPAPRGRRRRRPGPPTARGPGRRTAGPWPDRTARR